MGVVLALWIIGIAAAPSFAAADNGDSTGPETLRNAARLDARAPLAATPPVAAPGTAPQFRAFWASTGHEGLGSLAEIDDLVARAVQGSYNVINALILYKQDTAGPLHGALWNSNILPKATAYPGDIDPLAHLIQQAHARGLKVHGRLIPYTVSTAWPPVGNTLLASHPEWLCVTAGDMGAGPATISDYYFLDPGSPAVQEYIISIVRELVTDYEIDGIHWDFIRHLSQSSGYPADNGFSDSGLARFRAITGRSDTPGIEDDAWCDFRRREVDELVRRSRAEIASITSNPVQPVSLTAAVAGWGAVPTDFEDSAAYRSVFQNWELWMRRGWLDGACPMIYLQDHEPAKYVQYRGWVDAAIGWRYGRHMYIGTCLYRNSLANSVVQMQYAFNQGADGVINFAYGLTADNDFDGVPEVDWSWYPYLAANLYTQPAPTPPMPWYAETAAEGTLWGRITDGVTGEPVDDATVTVDGLPPVQTDGNGYYVVTLIPAVAAGTGYAVDVGHRGYLATCGQADVTPGGLARLDVALDTPLPPIIADVAPDPVEVWVGQEHFRQVVLEQGTADAWTLVTGPPGAVVSARGFVNGWAPSESDGGQPVDFTLRAENSVGSAEVSWQVVVRVPQPCEPQILTDFEDYPIGARAVFQSPRYSGSTKEDLELEPNVAKVTSEVAAFSGSKCYKVAWQFVDTEPDRWMRLTTSNAPYLPNPTIGLDHAIRVRLRVDAGRFRIAAGIRETGTLAEIGADGGAVGDIEWVGAATDIDGAPQGVLVEAMPGVWQTITFNLLTDPTRGMTGNGELSAIANRAVLEHLAYSIVDTAGPMTIYLDDIEVLCDVQPPTTVVVESRDALGELTPPPAYTESGAWSNSTIKSAAPGMAGVGSRFITYEAPNTGTDSATFVPRIDAAGRYEVFAAWANGANCSNAKYTIRHNGGETVQLIDQIPSSASEPANCDEWVSLGSYWFAAGQGVDIASVTVSEETVTEPPSPGWSRRVYADGLKLELVEDWLFGDYTGDGNVNAHDFAYWTDCMDGLAAGDVPPRCAVFDDNLDGRVDLADFASFMRLFDGSAP